MNFDIDTHTIYKVVSGSNMYGTNTPESDIDIRGVAIAPPAYTVGFLHRFEQHQTKEPDMTIFDLRKFMKLCADANPSVMEWLWAPPDCVRFVGPEGQHLIDIRDKFLSRKCRHTYGGYAFAQLKRIRTHRGWLLNPPKAQPTRVEYGLPASSIMPADVRAELEHLVGDGAESIGKATRKYLEAEKRYRSAMKHWKSYLGWRDTRNPKRRELEARYGYDTKHAHHLVRLLRMGIEVLSTGELTVRRPDATELLAIRNGAWSYERLEGYAEEMMEKMDEADQASDLPKQPNRVWLDGECQDMIWGFWRSRGLADASDRRQRHVRKYAP